MRIGSHEYANEAADDDVPKPAQSLDTLVLRQKNKMVEHWKNDIIHYSIMTTDLSKY